MIIRGWSYIQKIPRFLASPDFQTLDRERTKIQPASEVATAGPRRSWPPFDTPAAFLRSVYKKAGSSRL